jgi:hypothetical protein
VYAAISKVMEKYRDAKDISGNNILTEATWKVHANQERLVVALNGLTGAVCALQCWLG